MNVLTLDDVDVKGKAVLIRVDVNSPFDEKTGKISDNDRIRAHSETIKELSCKGSRLVVLAHQGRKGDPDFTNLEQHARLIEQHSGVKVEFVEDITGETAIGKIKSMKDGEVILLDNVRKLDEEIKKISAEEHSKSLFVRTLAPLFDLFVQDGFSVCHRPQASVVGFPFLIKSAAGRVLQKELEALEKLGGIGSATYMLGGAKPEEDIMVLKFASKNSENIVLTGGVFGLLCSAARGIDLGKNTEKLDQKAIEELKPMVTFANLMIPSDHVAEDGSILIEEDLPSQKMIFDIGPETAENYSGIIKESNVIFGKGPMGKYEDERFSAGTRAVLEAIAASKGFSLIGGGNTTDAIEKLKIPRESFGHISLAGGALLEYIAGMELPGIEVLKKWKV